MKILESLKKSTNCNDIEKVMKIVATFGGNEEDLIRIKAYIEKELRELGDNRILFFLEKDDDAVGMVQLILKNADGDITLANGKDIAHVHALQISKHQHRKGYAYKLMLLLEQEAKNLRLRQLTLGLDAGNEQALRLYNKIGYSLFKTTVKLYYMQKTIE